MTKVDIFSGFLGAGKTTLIRKLIKEAYGDEKLVLIENEFGEIGVDGSFLKDTGVQVNEMNSGCICCTLVGDFGKALNQVIEEYSPDRILIEPSGVGKLSDVIIAVRDLHNKDIELNAFTTVVDAKKCKFYIKNFGEFYKNQVEHAGTIILSHVDGLGEDKLDECIGLLREHNDDAQIVTTSWDEIDGAKILEAMEDTEALSHELEHLKEEAHEHHHDHDHEHDHEHHHDHDHDHEHHHDHDHHHHDHHHADEVFGEVAAYTAHKYSKDKIAGALDALGNFTEYGQVLRAKGVLECEDGGWIQFDYIPGEPEIRDCESQTTGMVCVIGVDLEEERIRELFSI